MYKDIEGAAWAGVALQGYYMFFTCSFHTLLLQPLHRYCSVQEPKDKAPDTLFNNNASNSRDFVIFPFSGQKSLLKTSFVLFVGAACTHPWLEFVVCEMEYLLASKSLLEKPWLREALKYFAVRKSGF